MSELSTPRPTAGEAPIEYATEVSPPLSVTFVATAPPRHCGIATFTADVAAAVRAADSSTRTSVVAIEEPGANRQYGPEVRMRVRQGDPASYRSAAQALNRTRVDVVNIQHEFGLYGVWRDSEFEDHLPAFLEAIRKPVVTTLHTVPPHPSPSVREAVRTIARHSRALIVMASLAGWLLREEYGVDSTPSHVILHGVPRVAGRSPRTCKERLGLSGRKVITTLGLIDPRKGLEYVIEAMPAIIARHPSAIYVVAGRTHPDLVQREGERYREQLLAQVRDAGLERHVIFVDQYLTQRDLVDYLVACDIYVTPYLDPNQITSGTLAYAIGAGKAVVSTPYLHALEALGEQRGLLVDFRDASGLARAILSVLDDKDLKAQLEENAAHYGRQAAWPVVGQQYLEWLRWAAGYAQVVSQPLQREGRPALSRPPSERRGLLRLANLTRHDQSGFRARYAAQGYDVDADPAGVVAPVFAGPEAVRGLAERTVDELVGRSYDGAVVGGRADLVCYLRDALHAAGFRCFSVDRRRTLSRDRVVESAPLGLVEILPAIPLLERPAYRWLQDKPVPWGDDRRPTEPAKTR